jgi:hypothetical protein
MICKSQRANNYGSTVWAYFNGDYAPSSPTNYNFHLLSGDGSTASSAAYLNTNVGYGAYAGNAMGTTATNVVSVNIMDILDYKNTNKNKKPIIEVIDEVNINEWEFWEMYWICQFKSWGLV